MQMKSLPISRVKRFSWSPLLILSIILLAAAGIIAVFPAFMAQPPSYKLPYGEANYGPPQYSLTIQSTDFSLQDVAPHLQDAFNSVYPQLVNRFAFDPATAPKNVILRFSSDLPYPSVTNGTTITLNADWIRQHPTDMGVLTHQLTYIVLHYPSSPTVVSRMKRYRQCPSQAIAL